MATMASTSRARKAALKLPRHGGRRSGPAQRFEFLVNKIAIGLGDLVAHRQIPQRRGIPDFKFLVVFMPGLARQLERRQLAKRQITWMTNTLKPESFDCLAPDLAAQVERRVAQALAG